VVLRANKAGNQSKNVKTVQEPNKYQTLCQEIEPNPSKDRALLEGDNRSFRDEFVNYFYLDSFVHFRIF
jgi:hypothetical protein